MHDPSIPHAETSPTIGTRESGARGEEVQRALDLQRRGELPAAEQIYEEILQADARHFDALHFLGVLRATQGRHEEAAGLIRRALAQSPRSAAAHYNLGNALYALDRLDEAVESYRRSLVLAPRNAEACNNLGAVYLELFRLADCVAACRKALAINPRYAQAHHNLGVALAKLNRNGESMQSFQAALSCQSDYAEAHCGLAEDLLRSGDFRNGWRQYEWRRRARNLPAPPETGRAPWLGGGDVSGKTIVLHYEQGLGDTLQFVRYAPLVAARGARVILVCQAPLARLLARVEGVARVINGGEAWPAPEFDFHCPLMSLPLAFDTDLARIPAQVPYLHPDAEETARWKARTGDAGGLKVGLVWAGDSGLHGAANRRMDQRRSLTLAQYAPLAGIAGVTFYSLQKGDPARQARDAPAGMELRDYTDELNDFADTAALVAQLDLVITVDTSVAHLAGGMAKPVWILSRYDSCWRWLLDREDSPWYPTARLFKQTTAGDWGGVIGRVRAELARYAARPR